MDMIKSRTLTSHTYNEEIADQIADAVMHTYYTQFVMLQNLFQQIIEKYQ